MPNSQQVIAFSRRLAELTRIVTEEDRRSLNTRMGDRESSMAHTHMDTTANLYFTNILFVRYNTQFWRAGNVSNIPATNPIDSPDVYRSSEEEQCINQIFKDIKRMILDEILSSPGAQNIKDFVRNNKEALIDEGQSNHAQALLQARGVLNSYTSVLQTAWRNFDEGIDRSGGYSNLFVGRHKSPKMQRIVAYYYLAITDPTLNATQSEYLKAQFITKLADIRRAHNEGTLSNSEDSPSCGVGIIGRCLEMSETHPHVEFANSANYLRQLTTDVVADVLNSNFSQCRTLDEKKLILFCLTKMCAGNLQQVENGQNTFSDIEFTKRLELIRGFGIEINNTETTLSPSLRNRINQQFFGKFGTNITPDQENKIRLMLLDPMSVTTSADRIYDLFRRSVTDHERNSMTEAERRELGLLDETSTFESEYDRLFQVECEARTEAWDIIEQMRNERNPNANQIEQQVARFKEHFNYNNVTIRIAQTLFSQNIWGNRTAVNGKIINLENKKLVNGYYSAFERFIAQNNLRPLNARSSYEKCHQDSLRHIFRNNVATLNDEALSEQEKLNAIQQLDQKLKRLQREFTVSIIPAVIEDAIEDEEVSQPFSTVIVNSPGITRENLEDILDVFRDPILMEITEDPVFFPNHPSAAQRSNFYDRDTITELFNTTRRKFNDIIFLQQNENNLRVSVANNPQLIMLIEGNSAQALGQYHIDDILGGQEQNQALLTILQGAAIDLQVINNLNLQGKIDLALATLYGQALARLRNEVNGLQVGEARCPLTRLIIRENDMQSGRLFKEVALTLATEAIRLHPQSVTGNQGIVTDLRDASDGLTLNQLAIGALNSICNSQPQQVFPPMLVEKLRTWGLIDVYREIIQSTPNVQPIVQQPQVVLNNIGNVMGYQPNAENGLGVVANQNVSVQTQYTGQRANRRFNLGVPNTGPTGQVSGVMGHSIGYPRMPVIHPYNPNGSGVPNQRHHQGIPAFSMALSFPKGTVNNLPSGIREKLIEYNIDINELDVFCCVQDMPWQGEQLLLRPHPWLHPNAPQQGNYNKNSNILVGISDINGSMGNLSVINGVSTHGEGGSVVYSAQQMPIEGINNSDRSHSFYSLVIDPETGKAALTQHMLVNDRDQQVIEGIQGQVGNNQITLQHLVDALNISFDNSTLNGTDMNVVQLTTPLEALQAMMLGGHPVPNQDHLSQYRLQEQQRLSLTSPSNQNQLDTSVNLSIDSRVYQLIHNSYNPLLAQSDLNLRLEAIRRALLDSATFFRTNSLTTNFGAKQYYLRLLENIYSDTLDAIAVNERQAQQYWATKEEILRTAAREGGYADFNALITGYLTNSILPNWQLNTPHYILDQNNLYPQRNRRDAAIDLGILNFQGCHQRIRELMRTTTTTPTPIILSSGPQGQSTNTRAPSVEEQQRAQQYWATKEEILRTAAREAGYTDFNALINLYLTNNITSDQQLNNPHYILDGNNRYPQRTRRDAAIDIGILNFQGCHQRIRELMRTTPTTPTPIILSPGPQGQSTNTRTPSVEEQQRAQQYWTRKEEILRTVAREAGYTDFNALINLYLTNNITSDQQLNNPRYILDGNNRYPQRTRRDAAIDIGILNFQGCHQRIRELMQTTPDPSQETRPPYHP